MSTGDVRSRLAAYRTRKEKQSVETCREPVEESKFENDQPPKQNETIDAPQHKSSWWIFSLKVVLWLLVWGFFIEVEFGAVYLVISGLLFIFMSLQGGKKRAEGELSAYSVFNKNFEAIEGTLSAEQFERELRYGPTSVR